jgi:hypothetical protein
MQLRGVLDPKRHYKAPDTTKLPKYFQVGHILLFLGPLCRNVLHRLRAFGLLDRVEALVLFKHWTTASI